MKTKKQRLESKLTHISKKEQDLRIKLYKKKAKKDKAKFKNNLHKKYVSSTLLSLSESDIKAEKKLIHNLFSEFSNENTLEYSFDSTDPNIRHFVMPSLTAKEMYSVKFANVFINLHNLMQNLPEMTSMAVGIAINMPVLKVCSALSFIKMIYNIMSVSISESQSKVLIALWKNCNNKQRIKLDEAFICVNKFNEKNNIGLISWKDYNKVLDELSKLYCIKIEDSVIILKESLHKSFRV